VLMPINVGKIQTITPSSVGWLNVSLNSFEISWSASS
jgi:hypothetical protein